MRFVERPEYQNSERLHGRFEKRIDLAAQEYNDVAEELLALQVQGQVEILSGEAKTDRRKKVQQSARSVLPNETETFMITTANARALQHTIEMRSSIHAETEIRALFFRIFLCTAMAEPVGFADFEIQDYLDGTQGAKSPYKKP